MACKTCGKGSSAVHRVLGDAREAFENIPMDLVSGVSWKQSLDKNHRLRGLGIILVMVGLGWLVVTFLNAKTGQCSN